MELLCCKQSSKRGHFSPQSIPDLGEGFATKYTSGKESTSNGLVVL